MNSNHTEQDECAVILTVDTKSYAISTIDLAVAMAASIRTRLHGLFIEDEDLLRVAALPFTREIAFPTALERSTDALNMQRSLRSMAEQLRKYLAQSAQSSQVQWSYDYICGRACDIGLKSDPKTIYTIVGQAVFRQQESRYSVRRYKLLLIENHSPHIINALRVLVTLLANRKIEITLIKNREGNQTEESALLRTTLSNLKQVTTLERDNTQLTQELTGTGPGFDYVIVSRHEPPEILQQILENSHCPIILVS